MKFYRYLFRTQCEVLCSRSEKIKLIFEALWTPTIFLIDRVLSNLIFKFENSRQFDFAKKCPKYNWMLSAPKESSVFHLYLKLSRFYRSSSSSLGICGQSVPCRFCRMFLWTHSGDLCSPQEENQVKIAHVFWPFFLNFENSWTGLLKFVRKTTGSFRQP